MMNSIGSLAPFLLYFCRLVNITLPCSLSFAVSKYLEVKTTLRLPSFASASLGLHLSLDKIASRSTLHSELDAVQYTLRYVSGGATRLRLGIYHDLDRCSPTTKSTLFPDRTSIPHFVKR